MPPGVVRLRDQHAAETRRVILQAARALFREHGYAATPVRLLASKAGVAVQTIYDAFGSKAGLLKVMPDLIDEEAGVLDLVAEIDQTAPGKQTLALYAKLRRQIRDRCGDIVDLLRSGASVDRGLAETLAEGLRRRRYGLERIMQRLAEAGALQEGLSPQRAADIASALCCDEVCDVLVGQCGWQFDDYERWLADTLANSLLRSDSA